MDNISLPWTLARSPTTLAAQLLHPIDVLPPVSVDPGTVTVGPIGGSGAFMSGGAGATTATAIGGGFSWDDEAGLVELIPVGGSSIGGISIGSIFNGASLASTVTSTGSTLTLVGDDNSVTLAGNGNRVTLAGNGDSVTLFGIGNNSVTITNQNVTTNTDSISFGPGANAIVDATHTTGVHAYVNTVPTGTASATTYSSITGVSPNNTDTLTFKGDAVTSVNATNAGAFASVTAGIANELASLPQHAVGSFTVSAIANATFIFDHGGASTTALSAADSLVEIVGTSTGFVSAVTSGVLTLHM